MRGRSSVDQRAKPVAYGHVLGCCGMQDSKRNRQELVRMVVRIQTCQHCICNSSSAIQTLISLFLCLLLTTYLPTTIISASTTVTYLYNGWEEWKWFYEIYIVTCCVLISPLFVLLIQMLVLLPGINVTTTHPSPLPGWNLTTFVCMINSNRVGMWH